jgi:superfamily II DNA or RNA helicase
VSRCTLSVTFDTSSRQKPREGDSLRPVRRTIATWQTLNNIERLRKFDPARFKLVIVDEAHHAAALSYVTKPHTLPPVNCFCCE